MASVRSVVNRTAKLVCDDIDQLAINRQSTADQYRQIKPVQVRNHLCRPQTYHWRENHGKE
jgi:hypothetical protein